MADLTRNALKLSSTIESELLLAKLFFILIPKPLILISESKARDSLLDGKTTSTELVEASLRMIERTQPLYNQYISVQKEQSLKAAADFDQKRLKGTH